MNIKKISLVLVMALGLLASAASNVSGTDASTASGRAFDVTTAGTLPAFNYGYTNGLYATLAGFLAAPDVDLKSRQHEINLNVPSFKRQVPVKAVIQNSPAPLVVILLGIDGKADSRLGKLWASWYANAGYHVLTFDSTFLPGFVKISGHGVTGNLVAESERVDEIIAAFLAEPRMKNNVTKVGVVGMSYGGIQALVLGQMAQQGRLHFKLEGLQSYSPPINLQHSGELIDRWYSEDRWNYTLAELATKIGNHKPVSANAPVPFSDSEMRAGIAAAFHLGMAVVIMKNNEEYKLNLLPRGDTFDDQYVQFDYAATWGFQKFLADMAYPYWQRKLNLKGLSDFIDPITLGHLIQNQPSYLQVVVSADDPINVPSDLSEIKAHAGLSLTVLPRGGHLGYVNDPWTKAKLMTLFLPESRQASR